MKLDQQAAVGRRWVRAAIWVGIFAGSFAALKVNAFFEGSSLISAIIILTALFLAAYFASQLWLKIVFLVPANVIIVFWVFIVPYIREGYVSASAASPDGRVLAQIYDPGGFMAIDRNFIVRVKQEGQGGKAHYTNYFRSPDEGFPPAERLLWSKDGRYLLLVGERASLPTVRQEACLPSGECLYLLVDTQRSIVYANTIDRTSARDITNARGVRDPRPFSVDDLSGIDFGESFPSLSH